MATYIGRVYKIIHNQSDIVYIGSTKNELRYRWQQHVCIFKKWIATNKTVRGCTIFKYFEKYGIENFKIMLIKEYEVCDHLHLEAREQLWISKLKCINELNPIQLPKKMYEKNYYQQNKEIIKARVKAYADANKGLISERNKRYREKNKEAMKAKRSEKMECECGLVVTKEHIKRHRTSKNHIKLMEQK